MVINIGQVEDTLFRIPPEPLAQESPVFADMLAIGGDVNPMVKVPGTLYPSFSPEQPV